jgi:hypothetical protein
MSFRRTRFDDATRVGAGDFHLSLVGLNRAEHLVQCDFVADRDLPPGDRGIFQTLTEVGHQEVAHVGHGWLIAFSTQSSNRSTPGNQSFSSRAGG